MAQVKGDGRSAADGLRRFLGGKVVATGMARAAERISLRQFLSDRRLLLTSLGTAGAWFVFDYAYYGNAVSAPKIVLQVLGKGATLQQSLSSTWWCSRPRRYRDTSSRAFSWTGSVIAGCS